MFLQSLNRNLTFNPMNSNWIHTSTPSYQREIAKKALEQAKLNEEKKISQCQKK